MSGGGGGSGGSAAASTGDALLATVTLDLNSAADQTLYTCTASTVITKVIFDAASSELWNGSASVELGFNAAVDDYLTAFAVANNLANDDWATIIPATAANNYMVAKGAAASVFKAHMTVLFGSAATCRVRVYGLVG